MAKDKALRGLTIKLATIIILLVGSGCESLATPPPQALLNPTGAFAPLSWVTQAETQGTPTATAQTVNTTTATPVNTPTNTPTPEAAACVWAGKSMPTDLAMLIQSLNPNCQESSAQARLTYGDGELAVKWVFALTAPFPTIKDEIPLAELMGFWKNNLQVSFTKLVMEASTKSAMESLWGKPKGKIEELPADQLVETAWSEEHTWAIVPFEKLEGRWKVIMLEGQSPLQKQFASEAYALTIPIRVDILSDAIDLTPVKEVLAKLPESNRDASKLATVIVTGVTALVRATAVEMEAKGLTAPAEEVGEVLREADILHISNEVPFATDCPDPQPLSGDKLIFCSKDEYIQLLEEIGTDVVELTGDHLSDWGPGATQHTLGMYKAKGWKYYGGGINLAEAKTPATFDVNGNKIAFIGCNGKYLGYNIAMDAQPGSWHCEMDQMDTAIKSLQEDGYNPIVTFQHDEVYSWRPEVRMVSDFREAAENGAVIVSGSQAHVPHNMEFFGPINSMIRYGLGNLFFDQYGLDSFTDVAFIDRHVFYNNHHIGTEILTVRFTDYSTPRWMNPVDRADMLRILFQTSGWE